MDPNIASEQSEHTPRTDHTAQSEMGGSLAADSGTGRKEEIVISPQERVKRRHNRRRGKSDQNILPSDAAVRSRPDTSSA